MEQEESFLHIVGTFAITFSFCMYNSFSYAKEELKKNMNITLHFYKNKN